MKKKEMAAAPPHPRSSGKQAIEKKQPAAHKNPRSDTPEIIVVGEKSRTDAIIDKLSDMRATFRYKRWPFEPGQIPPTALIIVAPLSNKNMTPAAAVRHVRAHSEWQRVPVVCIVPNNTTHKTVQAIYEASASAVYKWPAELTSLAAMTAESIGITRAKGRANSADTALARTIRAHLKTQRIYTSGIRIQVSDETAHVSGPINALWKKDLVVKTIEQVAGILQVNSDGLFVPHSGITDKKVNRSVQHIISNFSTDENMSITAKVSNGWVTLYGSIRDRRELQGLKEMLTHVRGVRGIGQKIVFKESNQSKRRSETLEKQIGELLKTTFPDARVKIRTYGHTVVIAGETDTLARRRDIVETVELLDDVERVVNKLQIRS